MVEPLYNNIMSLIIWVPSANKVPIHKKTQQSANYVDDSWNVLYLVMLYLPLCVNQGWGQFHFFNSIPIPIPLFSIPIPIPIPQLTISFNSNSNSNSGHFNSNSNSGWIQIQSQFQKGPFDVFLKIYYDYNNKVHVYKIIVIDTISLISLVKWL